MEKMIQADLMKNVWEIEQEILDYVDSFCRTHDIKYSLGYGTLLGAIRHQGFIPWDDDIDIIMPRDDYDRFIELWKESEHFGYIIQDEYNPPLDYPENFCKIRKDNTAFIQSEREKERRYHKGVFIDVFPVDHLAPTKVSRIYQKCWFAINMLFSRKHPDNSKGILGLGQRILLKLPKKMYPQIKKRAMKEMTKWNNCKTPYVVPVTMHFCSVFFPNDLFERLIEVKFNNKCYYCTANWDGYLKALYGDYMQLPPEEERVWKHSPKIIYLDHNFDL